MVAQVDEEQLPVVALAMNPAGEPDGGAGIAEAELAAGMGSVSVHRHAFGKSRFPPPGEGRNTTRETELVKAGGHAGKGRMAAVGGVHGVHGERLRRRVACAARWPVRARRCSGVGAVFPLLPRPIVRTIDGCITSPTALLAAC
jgi:hypothetical protein